jgi:hypothetical protein
MANTVIQLKYSSGTSTPTSLLAGEAAYSFLSDKLFIGNTTTGVITIGGKYYTQLVDAATDANTVSTIVKRDVSGNFSAGTISATLNGNAGTTTKWQTARNIGVSGDATGIVSVDGTDNANIPLTLSTSGVSAGSYGSVTQIPTFAVDAKGRITSAANVSISTSLNIAGDTGTDAVALSTDTITFVGGDGITSVVYSANSNVKFDVDSTVVRNTGSQTISGDFTITGNLIVSGNTITQDVESLKVEDSLIELASSNPADSLDIGFFGHYVNGGTKYTGLFRDATDGSYKLLTGGTEAPSAANTVNTQAFITATLVSNITGGTVSGLTSRISVSDGGTGVGTILLNGVVLGQGTSAVSTASSSTEGHILTVNASGVPTFSYLSGGTF